MVVTLVMALKSVRFRRHDHLVSVLFGDLLSHSYNITFSMFLYLVYYKFYKFNVCMFEIVRIVGPALLTSAFHISIVRGINECL